MRYKWLRGCCQVSVAQILSIPNKYGLHPPCVTSDSVWPEKLLPHRIWCAPLQIKPYEDVSYHRKKKILRARIRTFHLFEKFLFLPLPPLFGRCVLGADEPEPFEKKRKEKERKAGGENTSGTNKFLVFFLFHIWQLLDPRNMHDLRRARGISDWLIVTGFSLSICSSDE